MYRKIEQCIGELRVNHTDKDIAGALSEYFQIVKSVSYDYTSIATVADLRADHPELDFMDDEEIEEILEQAEVMRQKREPEPSGRLTREDVEQLCKTYDWFNDLYLRERILVATKNGIDACDLAPIVWYSGEEPCLEDVKEMIGDYIRDKRTEDDMEKARDRIFQKIKKEMERRDQIEERALDLIGQGRHEEAAGVLKSLDDSIIKGLYQEYWDLREKKR